MKQIMQQKISTKIATIVGGILLVVFMGLSIIVSRLSENEVNATIRAELSNLAYANGKQAQAILDSAGIQALALLDYVLKAYDQEEPVIASPNHIKHKSMVYDSEMSDLSIEKENYLIKNMWSAVLSNEDLVGLGVYFEPGQFDEAVSDYTLYVNRPDALNKIAESEGEYSSYGEQDYYKPAKETMKTHFTEPYQEEGQEAGVTMVTAVYPILYQNEFRGVVLADINVGRFSKTTTTSDEYKTLSSSILTDDFTIIYDSQSDENIGMSLAEFEKSPAEMKKIIDSAAGGEAFACSTLHADGRQLSQFFYPIHAGDKIWWAQTMIATADMTKDVKAQTMKIAMLSMLSLVVVVAAVVLVIRRLLKPMQDVVSAAAEIASGDLNIDLQVRSADEIGILAGTFTEMAHHLKTIIEDIGYLLGEMADGNFRIHTQYEEKYIGQYHEILSAMNRINRTLSGTLADINMASSQVSAGADQISGGAQTLSQGAAEQASSIEELKAAITNISAKISENAEHAQKASILSGETQQEVAASSQHMHQLMAAMEDITGTSNEIQKIIKTIDDIAFQTNILALNAAVEAARAGSSGKGFAVVADEVRSLAGKSAEAARNTTLLIESTLGAIKSGKVLADETAASLYAVVDKTETVHDTIKQIAKASEQQSGAVAQLVTGIEQVSAVVQTNSATAEESAAASEELSGQAQMLKDSVGRFRLNESVQSYNF